MRRGDSEKMKEKREKDKQNKRDVHSANEKSRKGQG